MKVLPLIAKPPQKKNQVFVLAFQNQTSPLDSLGRWDEDIPIGSLSGYDNIWITETNNSVPVEWGENKSPLGLAFTRGKRGTLSRNRFRCHPGP